MRDCLRVLKPGGHILVWSIPRTSHWTATAVEDAGFEIRDCIHHIFGQGFPKSLNIGKALQKQGSEEAAQWDGWGTQLKPAVETWWLARKPIEAGNVAAQVLATGTGGINIDGCRVGSSGATKRSEQMPYPKTDDGREDRSGSWARTGHEILPVNAGRYPANLVLSHLHTCRQVGTKTVDAPTINRFTDGMKPFGDGAGHPYESTGGGTEEQPVYECDPECMVRKLDEQSGSSSGSFRAGVARPRAQGWRKMEGRDPERSPAPSGVTDAPDNYGDQGGASRFFAVFEPEYDVPFIYTGKASKADKNADLEDMPVRAQHEIGEQTVSTQSNRRCRTCGQVKFGQPHCECETPDWEETAGSKSGNFHPTVKSQALMTYLVRLVTPKGGIVLDPFAGSGSTCVAAISEGMKFIGIEREAEYHVLAKTRTDKALGRAETEAGQKAAFDAMDELPQE